MERGLRPDRLDVLPSSPEATRVFKHWLFVFTRYKDTVGGSPEAHLGLLANSLSSENFELISECNTFDSALSALKSAFIQPANEVVARYHLATRRQNASESVDEYVRCLHKLSIECNFRAVSAETYRDEYVRDAFISGLMSQQLRTRLLENRTLTLTAAVDQARALELAMKDSQLYSMLTPSDSQTVAAVGSTSVTEGSENAHEIVADEEYTAACRKSNCFYCGNSRHPRSQCPARNATCHKCKKQGHFAKVCKSNRVSSLPTSASTSITLASVAPTLHNSVISVLLNDKRVDALIDTGSSENFVSERTASRLQLLILPKSGTISMASSNLTSSIVGTCEACIKIQERSYLNVHLSVLPELCSDVILGIPFLKEHSSVNLSYGGPQPPLDVCALAALKIPTPRPFSSLSPDCHPIATKSRKFNSADREFIRSEVQRLLSEDVIEASHSPWRAQLVVVSHASKKRMVVDYSETINKFTYLDAYPLPNVEDLVNSIAQYKVFSTIDLKSAYHLVPLHEDDRAYTAFEADGSLYQFKRLSFGLTNGVSCFQRIMNDFIERNQLKGTFAYLDDLTICGSTQDEHDVNLKKFLEAAKRENMTLNEDKCVFSAKSIRLLGYEICNNELRPDPSRLEPLISLPVPRCQKNLQRLLGLYAYYSKWVPRFSERIRPLVNASFPLSDSAIKTIDELKDAISKSVRMKVDEDLPFTVETDASEAAIGATLSQDGRPVAFFSRSLNQAERNHCAVEKEAYAIVESVRKWNHYLAGRHFVLVTDQKSVSFMFDTKHKSKIKNDKILRWKMELLPYTFDIKYRAGKFNAAADALSRNVCCATNRNNLTELHKALCHPGVVRLLHFIRARNLPYSASDVKEVISSCPTCCRVKPQFFVPENHNLVRAMRPFDRLSIDFKGPLPSVTNNKYLLVIVDEYSRFPFAFPCKDTSSTTVINCLTTLFSIFGLPEYVHSDRGSSFMSSQLKSFLFEHGVASSRSTPYHPTGNSQCERFVGSVWKTITLALKSKNLPMHSWELVLADALHSLRSLLCTATNSTPHERLFCYPRKTSSGLSIPTWLTKPGNVLLRRHVRNKDDPLVEEVQLIEANPKYAHIQFSNGREDTVSIQDLAPVESSSSESANKPHHIIQDDQASDRSHMEVSTPPFSTADQSTTIAAPDLTTSEGSPASEIQPVYQDRIVRRSSRVRRPVDRFSVHW